MNDHDLKYGQMFAELLTNALESEEKQLKELTVAVGDSPQTVNSVHEYYESWLSVPLLKEALRRKFAPRIVWEKGKIDIAFSDPDTTCVLATFEIKFKDLNLEGKHLSETVKDFVEQAKKSQESSIIEHYVVLVLCGSRQALAKWRIDKLQELVAKQIPAARLHQEKPPRLLTLNKPTEQCLAVFSVRVVVT